jgi:hypothetical protein
MNAPASSSMLKTGNQRYSRNTSAVQPSSVGIRPTFTGMGGWAGNRMVSIFGAKTTTIVISVSSARTQWTAFRYHSRSRDCPCIPQLPAFTLANGPGPPSTCARVSLNARNSGNCRSKCPLPLSEPARDLLNERLPDLDKSNQAHYIREGQRYQASTPWDRMRPVQHRQDLPRPSPAATVARCHRSDENE